ncbi:MAG: transcription factor RcaD, partial [Heteroscytonema crispum UTEX LB 1556]
SGKIPPSKITSPKAAERDAILKTLSDRGLIEAEMKIKKAKAEVWLTERGIEYLRDEYSPKGAALSDEEILQTIRMLDRELGTDNYLPIFHLRQKLQPPLSRDELDRLLYRLQGNDQIELSSLQEANAYTPEQVDAGITQNIGGSLFFISVN